MSQPNTRAPGEQIAYQGIVSKGDLSESMTLRGDGVIAVTARTRKRPVSAVRVVAASALGLAGAVLALLIAFDLAPSIFLGGGFFLAFLSGVAAVGVSVYALDRLLLKRQRFEVRTPIDGESLATLRRIKRSRPDVTRLLLDVAFASVRQERAAQALETARERSRIAGSKERIEQEAARAEEEHSRAQAQAWDVMGRLLDYVAGEEASRKGEGEF